jgi:hypothetical protein
MSDDSPFYGWVLSLPFQPQVVTGGVHKEISGDPSSLVSQCVYTYGLPWNLTAS